MFRVQSLIDVLAPINAEQQLQARSSLPRRLLRNSRRKNASLRALDTQLDALEARLGDLSRALGNSPEIHAPLVCLGDRCPDLDTATQLLHRLDVLSGGVSPSGPGIESGIYRLPHLGHGVVERRGGEVIALDAHRRSAGGHVVYFPIPGLFADLPFPPVYAMSAKPGCSAHALRQYERARALLSRVDQVVFADFERTITTTALLPPVPHEQGQPLPQAHWSFNLRLRLPGAVFVNPFSVGVPALCEGLLHEYLHQRMWLWWELCPPCGLPRWGPSLRSPISGQMRPLVTMLQALVIYRCVIQLHQALLRTDALTTQEQDNCRTRAQSLRAALPQLACDLAKHLRPGSGAHRVLTLVHEDFMPDLVW
ncbi:MAG: hypothetical protein ACRBN8_14690 [Nannocystales bacterium]